MRGKYETYAGWRRALKRLYSDVIFEGDKDICQAFNHNTGVPVPHKQPVGEWDGATGTIYAHERNETPLVSK